MEAFFETPFYTDLLNVSIRLNLISTSPHISQHHQQTVVLFRHHLERASKNNHNHKDHSNIEPILLNYNHIYLINTSQFVGIMLSWMVYPF
jgi:hypothetical protein